MEALKNNAIFWIMLSIAFFELGRFLNKRFKTPLLNPLLIAIALIIVFLKITGVWGLRKKLCKQYLTKLDKAKITGISLI